MTRLSPFTMMAGLFLIMTACQGPSVNLATSQPLKVDIAMRLDVFQHQPVGSGVVEPSSKPGSPKLSKSVVTPPDSLKTTGANGAKNSTSTATEDVEDRRRDRLGDIQTFKNSRLVGEGKNGLLVVLGEAPPGDYGNYVRRVVRLENADRTIMMQSLAAEKHLPLPEIQQQQGELWRNRSFNGEWVEVVKADGTSQWICKGE